MALKRLAPFGIVLLAVLLNVLGAVLLKEASDSRELGGLVLASVLIGVALLNIARFVVWGAAHRRYPVSLTYPINALFFPIIMVVSVAYGETIDAWKACGALFIIAGVLRLAFARREL